MGYMVASICGALGRLSSQEVAGQGRGAAGCTGHLTAGMIKAGVASTVQVGPVPAMRPPINWHLTKKHHHRSSEAARRHKAPAPVARVHLPPNLHSPTHSGPARGIVATWQPV